MDKIIAYCRNIGWKRFLVSCIGNIVISVGVAAFKYSCLGNSPYDGMNMAIADHFHIYYPLIQITINVILFIIQLIWGRHYIGVGTVFNMFLNSVFINSFYLAFNRLIGVPQTLVFKLVAVVIGVIVCSLGLSLYQQADTGLAPYDVLSILMEKKIKKMSYFACRMTTDCLSVLISFCFGGVIGIGTLISMIGFGPVVQFFDKHLTNKYIFTDR